MAVSNLSTAAKSARATALNTAIGGGATIKFYSAPMPAGPGTAITSQTLLGTLTCNATAFGDVSSGVLTVRAITQDSSADATNTAVFARVATSGATDVADFDVTATGGGGAIQLNTTSIVAGGPIAITSFTITEA